MFEYLDTQTISKCHAHVMRMFYNGKDNNDASYGDESILACSVALILYIKSP